VRINRYIANVTGLSRRAADTAIAEGRVSINGQPVVLGQEAQETDTVHLDGQPLAQASAKHLTIMLNKPVGYVCSRNGQGSQTVYDLLPPKYHNLKPVGRLDKDSSGLLLLTSDGALANQLTHPRYKKEKVYRVALGRPLTKRDLTAITQGVELNDGPSRLNIRILAPARYEVRMAEGRNRQIRRTFAAVGYMISSLHRTHFGPYSLRDLKAGSYRPLP